MSDSTFFDAQALYAAAVVAPIDEPVQAPAANLADREDLTDAGNAVRLVRLYGQDMRYVPGWGWLAWDGRRWARQDAGGAVMRMAKQTALTFYDDAQKALDLAKKALELARQTGDAGVIASAGMMYKETQKRANTLASWAKVTRTRGRLDAMIYLAPSLPQVTVSTGRFDADPMLLNVQNGTLDLRTGSLRRHDRAGYLSKLAPVAYAPAATCPTWLAFLDRIMAGNSELIGFLQRVIGYCLTGQVSEQSLFFLHGAGANGKSTLLGALIRLLGGDYAIQAAPDVLTMGRDRHPTEIADLAGARLVASIEVDDGKRLAEALVKQLTGGDRIKARLMRQDFFEFAPTFKILLAANHKPAIKGTDYAIWRRVKLIPFTVTLSEQEKDPHMPERLCAELPGILAWAVRGCLAWQQQGLAVPAAVRAATEAYRAESDALGAFLAECTVMGDSLQAQSAPLFEAYLAWARANNERELTRVAFGRQLEERGFDKYTDNHTKKAFYLGLGLAQGSAR